MKLLVLLLLSALPISQPPPENLVDSINQERGGRHWIDQKTAPPLSPAESLARFKIEPTSRIQLVASEPLVKDPVWIDFDDQGRLFAAEYTDYPIGPVDEDGTPKKDAAPLSQIVLLEDENGDGVMDRRTVFAKDLNFCHSFMPLMGGILAAAQTQILFLKDTDGDNQADIREVWFEGFTPAHPQMQIGCPRWGDDGWVYLTYAPGKIVCRRPGFETKEPVAMPRQDMRFHPVTMAFEPVTGLGQFGQCFDNEGRRFFCTNRNPFMTEMIPHHLASRLGSVSRRHTNVGPAGAATEVFPLVAMKSNWLSHAGTHTSACGVTAYRGQLWNSAFQKSVFACEPVGHLVTRSILKPQPNSPALTAVRARPKADFLASSDTWFRPSSLRTGPDGALYLADMYRLWVEHPKFLPPEIAARIDWRAGEERGRIWRIVPITQKIVRKPWKWDGRVFSLTHALSHPNGHVRQTAHRLLSHSRDPDAERALRSILERRPALKQATDLAVRCLVARGEWTDADSRALPPGASLLRTHIEFGNGKPWFQAIEAGLNSADLELRYTAALHWMTSDRELNEAQQGQLQQLFVKRSTGVDWFNDLFLLSKDPAGLLAEMSHAELDSSPAAAKLLSELARRAAASGTEKELLSVAATARALADTPLRVAVLTGLGHGIAGNANAPAKSIPAFLAHYATENDWLAELSIFVTDLSAARTDRSRSLQDRLAGVQLLAAASSTQISEYAPKLFVPQEPAELQAALMQIVRTRGGEPAATAILDQWKGLAAGVRSDAISLWVTRASTTKALLSRIEAEEIPSGAVPLDIRLRLLQNRDASIKETAIRIFGGVVSADRTAIAKEYRPAITTQGSAERGAQVFQKNCSKCHRIKGVGHVVGPDISDTRARSRDALLYDILDPNRRVDAQFSEYVVLTTSGRTLNGLLVSETPEQIVLRQPEGKETTVPRAEIEEMQGTGKSLMPVGIEKEVSVSQMTDLLEFLKQQ